MNRRRRTGVYGGTFDPPHNGHVAVARAAADAFGLDRVVWVPAGDPWQKHGSVVAPAAERLAMVRLAARCDPRFEVSDLEVRRSGPTYTADTLRELAGMWPDDDLFFVLGADAAAGVPGWERGAEAMALARFVAVGRAGHSLAAARAAGMGVADPGVADISSTAVRASLAAGRADAVPPAVLARIARSGLYRPPGRRSAATAAAPGL